MPSLAIPCHACFWYAKETNLYQIYIYSIGKKIFSKISYTNKFSIQHRTKRTIQGMCRRSYHTWINEPITNLKDI